MAAQARRNKTLRTKLDELNHARVQINNCMDQMTQLGTSWIQSQGVDESYQSIREQLESFVDQLYEVLDKTVGTTSPKSPGTSLDEILNRMDVLENRGNALHGQVGLMEQTVNSWVLTESESIKRRLTEAEGRLTNSEGRLALFRSQQVRVDERLIKSEKRHDQIDEQLMTSERQQEQINEQLIKFETMIANTDMQLRQLEKWRQDDRKELDECCVPSAEGGVIGRHEEIDKMFMLTDRLKISEQEEVELDAIDDENPGKTVISGTAKADREKEEAGPRLLKHRVDDITASMPSDLEPVKLTRFQPVKCLNLVSGNLGGHYDTSTGVFTVPANGKYRITLSHTQCEEDDTAYIVLVVMRECVSGASEALYVGRLSMTWGRAFPIFKGAQLHDTGEADVVLSAGDRLWVRVWDLYQNGRLAAPSSFSCKKLVDD